MRDSACSWFIPKNAKVFWSYVKHFWILTGVGTCRILISLFKWHGVKVGPGAWDLKPGGHGTWDPEPLSKFKPTFKTQDRSKV